MVQPDITPFNTCKAIASSLLETDTSGIVDTAILQACRSHLVSEKNDQARQRVPQFPVVSLKVNAYPYVHRELARSVAALLCGGRGLRIVVFSDGQDESVMFMGAVRVHLDRLVRDSCDHKHHVLRKTKLHISPSACEVEQMAAAGRGMGSMLRVLPVLNDDTKNTTRHQPD
jgi:hypothetical protein